jgi:molecular chaperone GrpE
MTSEPRKTFADREATDAPAEAETETAAAEEVGAPGAEPAPEAEPEASEETVEERAARLEADLAGVNDRLLRALAETENVRRRAERDRRNASKYAIAEFAREMLRVADNLARALAHLDPETRGRSEAVEQLAVGVEMVERDLQAVFERFGITPIEALGRKFDHNVHEAMFELEDSSQPAGTVVQELEKGYMLEDRLLRPARVGVAKGGPAANDDSTPAETEAASEPPGRERATAYEKRADSESESGGGKGGQVDEKL